MEPICPICYEHLDILCENETIQLICGHWFHKDCLR